MDEADLQGPGQVGVGVRQASGPSSGSRVPSGARHPWSGHPGAGCTWGEGGCTAGRGVCVWARGSGRRSQQCRHRAGRQQGRAQTRACQSHGCMRMLVTRLPGHCVAASCPTVSCSAPRGGPHLGAPPPQTYCLNPWSRCLISDFC